jgi:hypothetical protein
VRSGTGTGYGLLNPTSTDAYYARELEFPRDCQAFTTPGLMWEAARQDAVAVKLPVEDHVATIEGSVAKFFSDGGLFDREELLAALRKSLIGEGTFTLLLGGKSVGKSFVMLMLAREYNQAESGIMVDSTSQPSHRIRSLSIQIYLIPGVDSRRACHMP